MDLNQGGCRKSRANRDKVNACRANHQRKRLESAKLLIEFEIQPALGWPRRSGFPIITNQIFS